jgi:hypothetical protein
VVVRGISHNEFTARKQTFNASKTNELEGSTIFKGVERQNLHNLKVQNNFGYWCVFNIINSGNYNGNHNKNL